jgi:hypothetical protein
MALCHAPLFAAVAAAAACWCLTLLNAAGWEV